MGGGIHHDLLEGLGFGGDDNSSVRRIAKSSRARKLFGLGSRCIETARARTWSDGITRGWAVRWCFVLNLALYLCGSASTLWGCPVPCSCAREKEEYNVRAKNASWAFSEQRTSSSAQAILLSPCFFLEKMVYI